MAEIIDLTAHLNKQSTDSLDKIKKELQIELEKLDFDIEKELKKYVIFDTSNYYKLIKDDERGFVTKDKAMKLLLTAFEMLVELNEEEAAIEVENIITRLE
jgi:hypothetical protein